MTARYRLVAHRWDDRTGEPVRKYRRGDVLDVPDDHVERLLRAGAIEPLDGSVAPPAAAPVAAKPQVTAPEPTPTKVPDAPDESESVDTDDDSADEPTDVEPKRPPQVADKSVWVAYAVKRGMTKAEAEDMTKRELIAALR